MVTVSIGSVASKVAKDDDDDESNFIFFLVIRRRRLDSGCSVGR
jgi:hypothetical protein